MTHPLEFFYFCPHCGSEKFNPHHFNSKKCGDCGFEFYKNPAPAVACFIYDEEGRLLVQRRAKDPGKGTLDLPGGFIDLDETAEAAAIRELKEETNLDIEIERLLFTEPNRYEWSGYDVQPLDLFYEGKVKDFSTLKRQESEVAEIMFIHKKDIRIEDFGLPSIRQALKRIL